MNTYEPIIGLEIHVELATNSKMFCGCPAKHFGKEPNTQTCPVCLGLPGTLPVPNKRAIEWTVLLGLALGCEIPLSAKFDRKNYFYPDLPKGYQISQYDEPFAINGLLKLKAQSSKLKTEEEKTIRIRRVHLEEDTGKLIHAPVNGENATLIDFNRSGVPLVEIVTEPDITSADEAKTFLQKLQQIIRYLGISSCDMEKGSMRLEPNISLREVKSSSFTKVTEDKQNKKLPNYKVEVKNINSFNFAKKAIDYEIERQTSILERGETPKQETRGWNEDKKMTISQRSKEEAHDYRYFPEPDIPPIQWAEKQIREFADQVPELPDQKMQRFIAQYQLSSYNAELLTQDKTTAGYFEAAVADAQKAKTAIQVKDIANWIVNKKVDVDTVLPADLVKQIVQKTSVVSVSSTQLDEIITQIITKNPQAVADYKKGKESAVMFLVGCVMREVKGKAGAQQVKEKLIEKLKQ